MVSEARWVELVAKFGGRGSEKGDRQDKETTQKTRRQS